MGQGLTTYSVLRGSEADSEIDTPNAAMHPLGEGEYRILVNSNAETQVIVRSGSADVSTPQGSTHVEKGQMITVAGTRKTRSTRPIRRPAKDEWDSWNNDRDKRIASAESWQHTDRYYTGSEDLDQERHMERDTRLRPGVGSGKCRSRLGALSRGPLGL